MIVCAFPVTCDPPPPLHRNHWELYTSGGRMIMGGNPVRVCVKMRLGALRLTRSTVVCAMILYHVINMSQNVMVTNWRGNGSLNNLCRSPLNPSYN